MPLPSLNWASTVFVPVPGGSVQAFEVAYGSQAVQDSPMLAKRIWATTPELSVAESASVTETELVVAAPPLITMDPVGGVVSVDEDCSMIESEYDAESSPAPFLNCTYTILEPSPAVRVQGFEVAYASQPDQEDASLLKRICVTPDSASAAESARTTETVFVVAAPPLIVTDPVGGVMSTGNCRVIESEYETESSPAPFLNWTYTVLAPSPEDKVQDLEVEYVSQPDHDDISLLKRI